MTTIVIILLIMLVLSTYVGKKESVLAGDVIGLVSVLVKLMYWVFGLIIAPVVAIFSYFHYNSNLQDREIAWVGLICASIAFFAWRKVIKKIKGSSTQSDK